MALSPLDIQNKTFPNKMRGYNPDEVDDFLDQVTRDYEELTQKNRELEKGKKHAEEKLQYFNELKDALNQSIIVAQDTADKVKSNANNEADVIVKNAQNSSDQMMSDAKNNSEQMVNDAQEKADAILAESKRRAKEIVEKAVNEAKTLATETDDLKKKTRVFHQRLSLMLETQLETVKSKEWDELLKPFSTYIEDSNSVVKGILDKADNNELDKADSTDVEFEKVSADVPEKEEAPVATEEKSEATEENAPETEEKPVEALKPEELLAKMNDIEAKVDSDAGDVEATPSK
jgi:cell division initiation protein